MSRLYIAVVYAGTTRLRLHEVDRLGGSTVVAVLLLKTRRQKLVEPREQLQH